MEQAQKNMLLKTACKVRMGVIEGTTEAKSGHPGGSLSAADIIPWKCWSRIIKAADEKC